MERSEILEQLSLVIEYKVGLHLDLKEEQHIFNDLGFDSLDSIEVIMECEREFDLSIADGDADKFETVKDIVDYLDKSLNA